MQSNYPSIETLMRVNRDETSKDTAKLARTILKATTREELEELPVYEQYYQKIGRQMYNPHNLSELKMQLLDIVLEGYGVESLKTIHEGYCDYVNFGDTYDMTVCYFQHRFIVSSWGDIAERYETE